MTVDDRYIIGFSDSVHDRAVCLFRGTEPVVAIEEERLTRQRYALDFEGLDRWDAGVYTELDLDGGTSEFHERRIRRLVDYCLSAAGISESDVSLWVGSSLHTAFPLLDRAVFLNHHLAHAASAFFGSGAEDAAVLVVDGYGDSVSGDAFETMTTYRASGTTIDVVERVSGVKDGVHLGNSAGIFYRIGTLLSGFSVVDEGKAMGLAGHGRPRYLPHIMEHIRFGADKVEIRNESIWQALQGLRSDAIEDRADMAASFQAALEQIVVFYARRAHELTGCRTLCMAGGVALNCVANQKVLDTAGFSTVAVFPAAADNGIAMGAAYYGAHVLYGGGPAHGLVTPCLGRAYRRDETLAALGAVGGIATVTEIGLRACAERAAGHLAAGELVMWFQEGSEIGPRALGHRSIFGDPRSVATRERINAAVKSREAFRPLAPMVLEKEAGDWFDCGRSPYMLFTPTALPRTRELAPAIVHADGSARVQTLADADNPAVHELLLEFQRLTGVPMVINTSFNLRGEPIVETPMDAVRAFAESPVSMLCIDGFLVDKRVDAE
ncbi:Carbamoyltransferase [Parafrankia sp. EAN1pec]|uniref:carbamoyltransferase family protein n=1 Tax=Parafrankia sp. (strain EAN1pec) TaxID=298653 RepID=UPI00015DA023|nr:Carbamoyltransferase [Frankia sp. EAN1pec]